MYSRSGRENYELILMFKIEVDRPGLSLGDEMRPVGFYRCLVHVNDVHLMFLLEYVHL
jgi:hypothetical protein